jgi:hypothetical protein
MLLTTPFIFNESMATGTIFTIHHDEAYDKSAALKVEGVNLKL